MQYNCRLVPFNKLLFTPRGMIEPLCDMCSSMDCSNPIHIKKVSVLGLDQTYRLYFKGNGFYIVVECDGFLLKEEEHKINGND